MDRNEIIIATSILLFGAFCLGFIAHWIVARLSRVSRSDLENAEAMAQSLHRAEEARAAAEAEQAASEAYLTNRVAQTEAELRTAMEGLRLARQEVIELQDVIRRGEGPNPS